MKFECGDLERALAVSDLMPEAREHLKHCAACRHEYRLWNEISSTAKLLHEDWETPDLWPRIRKAIEAEQKPRSRPVWTKWQVWAVAATLVLAVALFFARPKAPAPGTVASGNQDFLTEQALHEVEANEAAYRRSIEKLSHLAQSKLKNLNPATAVNYREKLLMLDTAISDTRASLDHNRFNVRLQMDLAGLYREKQQTLEELLTRDQKN
jgi:predicted anti-sigma-YlaC factor YlaD